MNKKYLLAIDQGTSSSRCVIYDLEGRVLTSEQQEFPQRYPRPGWVEHEPEAIWQSVLDVTRAAMAGVAAAASEIAGVGITNQRETTVIWERKTGRPVYDAIVWQDRRTADRCDALRSEGAEDDVNARTGLMLDPYFSATKIAWILDEVEGVRERAEAGELAFGTIDSFLLWRLTGGRVHATDVTNASRTMLYNIHALGWDDELLKLFGIPHSLLPEVRDCAYEFGMTEPDLFGGEMPILGIAGDQQAALIGQAGLDYGMTKSTYGTGCFVIANTGATALQSGNRLLTTIASGLDGTVSYGLEGSVFVAGSAVQWLRDALGVIKSAAETETVANRSGVVDDVYVVPAFAGLGAPYWDAHARGAILGLTSGSDRDRIVTATLQSVAYQTRDLFDAMAEDGISPSVLRVDGGMVANNWFLQFLADVLDVPVERPENVESTVLGAACLAAYRVGILDSVQNIADLWHRDAVFDPAMSADQRSSLLAGWADAVARVRGSR